MQDWLAGRVAGARTLDMQCDVGQGVMPIVGIFKQLRKMGYHGCVNLEYKIKQRQPAARHAELVQLHARRAGWTERLRAPTKPMAEIPIGTKHETKLLVDNDVAINFLGIEGARVLATPMMIGWMERTCRDLVLPFLEPGHDTVGTHVDVYHLAATPMGMTVTFKAEVIGVADWRVTFRVEAWDEKQKAGEGTHERAIINIARFTARMQAKNA